MIKNDQNWRAGNEAIVNPWTTTFECAIHVGAYSALSRSVLGKIRGASLLD